jgi:tetratricopeptide (TPR) repeat protein
MKRWILYILSLLILVEVGLASDQGGTESPFVFGAGAREISLGGACTAESDAATAPFWNASRLARAEQFSFAGFHSNLYESDVAYQYLGFALPTTDFGAFGLGIFRLGIGGIEKRDAGDMYIEDIKDNRFAAYLSYARTLSNYSIGLTATLEYQSLDGYSTTSSPGVNLSLSRRFELESSRFKWISIAANGRNLLKPSIKLVDESISYPMAVDLGLSMGVKPNPNWNQTAEISAGLTKADYLDPILSAGIQYSFEELLHIRGGVRDGNLSFGAGLSYKALAFDYALVERELGSLHMFTLTTTFGSPVSERRKARVRKREAEFDRLMQDRLIQLNRDKVNQLVSQGRKSREEGNLIGAGDYFDRALFMARSSNLDTIAIWQLADENKTQLDEVLRLQRYRQHLDSAETKFQVRDYWEARYYASLALTEAPDSDQAKNILSRADEAIARVASREETIEKQLWVADSLLSYGQIDQSRAVLSALDQFAPGDPRIMQARRKAGFEYWRTIASSAYSGEKFNLALMALDSALVLFPGHEWCLDLQGRIDRELKRKSRKAVPVVSGSAKPVPLSPELRKEVSEAYEIGQKYFTRGELKAAIEYWEKVERLAPNYSSVRSYLVNAYKFVGVDYYSRSLFEEAVSAWEKAAEFDPENEEIQGYIKRTEIEIRKLKELSYEHP